METAERFKVDDRVQFDLNGTPEYQGTGTVLGLAVDYIVQHYIVLLDKPIRGEKAILVSNALLKKICKHHFVSDLDEQQTSQEDLICTGCGISRLNWVNQNPLSPGVEQAWVQYNRMLSTHKGKVKHRPQKAIHRCLTKLWLKVKWQQHRTSQWMRSMISLQ